MQSYHPFQNQLNPEQWDAVITLDRPVLVLAGAGSGKTRVITYRIAYSILEKYSRPAELLAVTFTNKSAGEMKYRVETLLKGEYPNLWISTFHSACVRILRQHIDLLGYPRDFTIYDDDDQIRIIRQIMKELNYDPKQFQPRIILSKISWFKSYLQKIEKLNQAPYNPFYKMLLQVNSKYHQILKSNQALDFDDLLLWTVRLLEEKSEIRQYYQNRFKHILIDEYQDTNQVQYLLIRLLSGATKSICAVGDDDQSIYAWRGADINNIRNFQSDYSKVKIIKLEQNYRSTQSVLNAANRLIEQNHRRNKKKLWTNNQTGQPVQLMILQNELDEADWVVEQIYQWKNILYRDYRDIAIFYRTHAQSRAFEDKLRSTSISYQIIGGIKFYDRKEIKDLLAYLRLIMNPDDELSLKRIINIPVRGLGEKSWDKIRYSARENILTCYQIIAQPERITGLSRTMQKKIAEFYKLIQEFSEFSRKNNISELLRYIIDKLNYEDYLKNSDPEQSNTRIENIQELVSAAVDFENNKNDPTVSEYLNEIALLSDIDLSEKDLDAVNLMTLHAAKGLEFPLVFLVGMEENIFPSIREKDEYYRLEELEEERRLCYVGVTRAREQLILTAAYSRRLYGQLVYNSLSIFIKEIEPVLQKNNIIPAMTGRTNYFNRRINSYGRKY